MNILTQEKFNDLIKQAYVKPRLKKEVRFVASTANLSDSDWEERELLSIADRTGSKGVLLIQPDEELFIISYEISNGLTDKSTGRSKPVICDFCRTWQAGNNAARITFRKDLQSLNSSTFLCCADLACSSHVRGKTLAAKNSRAQIREDLNNEQRVERLKNYLRNFITEMELKPVSK